MHTREAIHKMIDTSGATLSGVSKAMGRSRNFLHVTLDKGSVPQADTLANIAAVMGYRLVLEGHGEQIEIDPTIDAGRDTQE